MYIVLHTEKFITGQNEREETTQIQPLPKVLRVQAIRSKQLRNIYNCYIHGVGMPPKMLHTLLSLPILFFCDKRLRSGHDINK
jgi:hypothetical protein